jgi:hypothetical protein
MPTKTLTVTLPRPHEAQAQVIAEASRFNVVCCGRRFGKTMLGINRSAAPDVLAYPVGWFSPSYKMLLEVWRECVRIFAPITLRSNVQDRRIEFVTGGLLEFWSLDNPDVARGRKYKRAIIDEAAMIPMLLSVFHHVIRPALADYQGDAWFLSTPKGMNDFKTIFDWGNDPLRPEWASWQMPTSFNPFIADSEIEAMRQEMPARTYNQEVLAIFTENEGAVFRNIRERVTQPPAAPDPNRRYAMGVDWAQSQDFTALIVIEVDSRRVCEIDRFNQIGWDVQRGRLRAMAQRWRISEILAEHNSIGGPNIEQLQGEGLPVRAFTTTSQSKQDIMIALQLAFERGDIGIPDNAVLIGELESYEATRLPSGRWRYAAPEGMHDDTVMALALAWEAANRPSGIRIQRQVASLYNGRQATNGHRRRSSRR